MRKKKIIQSCLLAFSMICATVSSFGQCPTGASFVIRESRCKENGSITINATPAGTYTYEIISGPELAALSNNNVFTGLGAGNYVVAIYGSGCSRNYAVTVPGNYQDPGLLVLDSTNVVECPGGTGCITVKQPTQGRAPYRYSIIAGPVTKPSQVSPRFCGLPEGTYTIQAFDSCGVVRTSSFDVGVDTGDVYGWVVGWDLRYSNCNDLIIPVEYGYMNTNIHTQLRVWYVTPAGDTIKASNFHTVDRYGGYRRDTLVGRSRTYGQWQLLIYDECGRILRSTFDYDKPTYAYSYAAQNSCSGIFTRIANNWRFDLTVRFIVRRCSDSSIIYDETLQPPHNSWWSGDIEMLYDSCYLIETFNQCGDTLRATVMPGARPAFSFDGCANPSCETIGRSQMYLNYPSGGSLPFTYTILSGPANVGDSMVATSPWETRITWGNLVPGIYRVMVRDACNQRDTITIDASWALNRRIDVNQTPHCSGGANLNVKVTSNYMPCVYYYWGMNDYLVTKVNSTYPINYNPINVATTPVSPTSSGTWQGDFINVNEDSLFLRIYSEGGCAVDTMVRIQKYTAPTLQDVRGFVCGTSGKATMNYTVRGGLAPFRFRIKPDNATTWGPWQDSSVFNGLSVGTYDVNVEDACPNGSIRSVSFTQWQKSNVVISTPCGTIGQPITLTADPPVSLVSYQWLFNNAVVGTGSTYSISSYTPNMQGTYKLRQVFRGGACVDSSTTMLLTCSVLPLVLGDFDGEFHNDLVKLQWSTLTDVPGSRFIVERSTDGANFKRIGEMVNQGTTEGSTYRFVDNQPGSKNFYRIGFSSNQGNIFYSNVIKLSRSIERSDNLLVNINPNPFRNKFNVQINAPRPDQVIIRIFDVLGKKIAEKSVSVIAGNNTIIFDEEAAALTKGYYFVEVSGDQILHRKKIMKE